MTLLEVDKDKGSHILAAKLNMPDEQGLPLVGVHPVIKEDRRRTALWGNGFPSPAVLSHRDPRHIPLHYDTKCCLTKSAIFRLGKLQVCMSTLR